MYKKTLILLSLLLAQVNYSVMIHNEINWEDYADYGLNLGKYRTGNKNVTVYKKNGEVNGVIDKPIPNFDGINDGPGGRTVWGNGQFLGTAGHVGDPGSLTFISRFRRTDLDLYDGAKGTNRETFIKDFSEKYESAQAFTTYKGSIDVAYSGGFDFEVIKLKSLVWDVPTYQLYDVKTYGQITKDSIITRASSGVSMIALENGAEVPVYKDRASLYAGGFMKFSKFLEDQKDKPYQQIRYQFGFGKDSVNDIPLPNAVTNGDSGSSIFVWNEKTNRWEVFGVVQTGSGLGYSAVSNYGMDSKYFNDIVNKYEDKPYTEINGQKDITIQNNQITYNGSSKNMPQRYGNYTLYDENRSQIFDIQDAVITVTGNNDNNIAHYRFNKNTTITGTGTLKNAGFVVEKDATLNYSLNVQKGNTIRKIGDGNLNITGSTKNEGELNVGGSGIVSLGVDNGYAFSHIRLAGGNATIRLDKDNQLNDNKIYFSRRGGSLDTNGHNLTFNDIYHMDNGANIKNSNNSTKSTFTFTPNSNRVYLGNFNGNMDLTYRPTTETNWSLRGENSEIKGDFKIEKGSVTFEGDQVVHGTEKYVNGNEYFESKFGASNIILADNTNIDVKRATKLTGNIKLGNNSNLKVEALGKILHNLFENEDELNKVVIAGDIVAKSNNKISFKTENNNNIEIKGSVKGTTDIETQGNILIKNLNDLSGKVTLNKTNLTITDELTSNNVKFDVKDSGNIIRVNLKDLKITDNITLNDNKVVVSLTSSNVDINGKVKDNVYIGTNKELTIGNGNEIKSNKLYLLGDGGTVTLKYSNIGKTDMNITLGDGKSGGKLIVEKLVGDKANFVLNKKTSLDIKELGTNNNSKFISLNYGSSVNSNLVNNIKNSKDGMVILDTLPENAMENVYYATEKGKTLNLTNNVLKNVETYKLGGAGSININSVLSNKPIILDGQYNTGGVAYLGTNLSNSISVLGNKYEQNNGDFKLVLNTNLTQNNNLDLYNGGILDINGKNASITLGKNTKDTYIINGSKINSRTNPKLTLNNNEDKVLNSRIVGNLDLYVNGNGTVTLANEKNNFVGNIYIQNNGGLSLIKDTYIYPTSTIYMKGSSPKLYFSGYIPTLYAENGKIYIDTSKPSMIRTFVFKKPDFSSRDDQKKTSVEFIGNSFKEVVEYETFVYQLYGTLKFRDQIFKITKGSIDGTPKGQLIIENSILHLKGALEMFPKFSDYNILLDNSQILLESYNPFKSNTRENTFEVKGNSIVGVGNYIDKNYPIKPVNDTDLYFNFKVDTGNNLIVYNDVKELPIYNRVEKNFTINITSKVSGNGNLIFDVGGKTNTFTLKNNLGDFAGNVYIKPNKKIEMIYDITPNTTTSNEIKYKIKGENSTLIAKKDVKFNDLENYYGTLKLNGGTITLNGDKAVNSYATLEYDFNNRNEQKFVLNSNTDTNSYLKTKGTTSNLGSSKYIIEKTGSGDITFKKEADLSKATEIRVNAGTVTFEKDELAGKNITLNNGSKLALGKDLTLTSTVTGGSLQVKKDAIATIDSDKLKVNGIILDSNSILKVVLNDKTKSLNLNLSGSGDLFLCGNGTLSLSLTKNNFTGNVYKCNLNGTLTINNGNGVTEKDFSNAEKENKSKREAVTEEKDSRVKDTDITVKLKLEENYEKEFNNIPETVKTPKEDVIETENENDNIKNDNSIVDNGNKSSGDNNTENTTTTPKEDKVDTGTETDTEDKTNNSSTDITTDGSGNSGSEDNTPKTNGDKTEENKDKKDEVDSGSTGDIDGSGSVDKSEKDKVNTGSETETEENKKENDVNGGSETGVENSTTGNNTNDTGNTGSENNAPKTDETETEEKDVNGGSDGDIDGSGSVDTPEKDKVNTGSETETDTEDKTNSSTDTTTDGLENKEKTDETDDTKTPETEDSLGNDVVDGKEELPNSENENKDLNTTVVTNKILENIVSKYLGANNYDIFTNKIDANVVYSKDEISDSYGINSYVSLGKELSNIRLGGAISLGVYDTIIDKENNLNVDTDIKLGIKYSFVDLVLNAGVKYIKDNYIITREGINLGFNNEFNIKNIVNLTYTNNLGLNTMQIVKKYNDSNDKLSTPVNIYYETGVKVNYKMVTLGLSTEIGYNFTKINDVNKDKLSILLNAGLSVSPIKNLDINLSSKFKAYNTKSLNVDMNLGISYSW